MTDISQAIKLYIITHPDKEDRVQSHIADLFDVSQCTVSNAFKELNIPPKSRPEHCVG